MDGVKLRSVCDACTSAKVRCNGKVPCERCLRKSIECHYLPFKHRGGGGGDSTAKPSSIPSTTTTTTTSSSSAKSTGPITGGHPVVTDYYFKSDESILDEHERRTWSVFFTLYRSFGKGCSLFWFKQQLFKMLRFLEHKEDAHASNALLRLKSWMTALGIDVTAPPETCNPNPPHLRFDTPSVKLSPLFATSLTDLQQDAKRRNLPSLLMDSAGKVTVNESFQRDFDPTAQEMERILKDSAGGFLPWCGDLLSRLLCTEADLVLYLRGVANNMDAMGKPQHMPCDQIIPSMSILRVRRKSGQEVLCIIRAVQTLHMDVSSFAYSSMIVFDIPVEQQETAVATSSKVRPFSDVEQETAAQKKQELVSVSEEEDNCDLPPLPNFDADDDSTWLDNLLSWAAEGGGGDDGDMSSHLPIADDMYSLNIEGGA